jgi:hypothetical protein
MYTPAELGRKLESAYGALEDQVLQQADAESDLCVAQTDLTDARAEILRTRDPKELGPNVEAREAQIAQTLAQYRRKVAECEQARMEARTRLEIGRLRVENLRAQLRLLEVAAGLPRAA